MALSPELVGFVKEGLDRGLPREQIADILIRAGWPADQVRRALAGFADVESPIPVPRPAVSTRPREAFLYVVMFMALFVSAYALGAVVFGLIDLALPDPAGMPLEVIRELLRLSVAALVVASPVFAFVTRVIRRGVEAQPSSRRSRIRQQLTYLTLFIASCVLVGAVTALVYSVLGGELTARFVLKSLTVTAIAGGAFGYYLRDLRQAERDPREARAPRRRDPLRPSAPRRRRWRWSRVWWRSARRRTSAWSGWTHGARRTSTPSRGPSTAMRQRTSGSPRRSTSCSAAPTCRSPSRIR